MIKIVMSFACGGLVFTFLNIFIVKYDEGFVSAKVIKLISECEAPLPRDQHCKIIAVKE